MALPATAKSITQLLLKTYDDLQAMPDDENRYELIFGEIVMSPSPRTKHQRALSSLNSRMKHYVDARQLGEVLFAPLDVRFSDFSVVQPDILYVSRANLSRLGELFVDGPPDIAVEVLSPSNRMQDLVRKAALYLNYGVQEYWIVDPETETITVNELVNGQYVARLNPHRRVRSQVLAGFEVDLNEIFAEPEWMKPTRSEPE